MRIHIHKTVDIGKDLHAHMHSHTPSLSHTHKHTQTHTNTHKHTQTHTCIYIHQHTYVYKHNCVLHLE
jgi:hypothetical protein